MPIFRSHEILYESLEGNAAKYEAFMDALQLPYIFSYFHFPNIHLDIRSRYRMPLL
ncbi:uncharacterized protein BCR38DRAFT_421431, partial [Pseudomassariella vexata]